MRAMMRSLLVNSTDVQNGLRNHFWGTGGSCTSVKLQMKSAGITVELFPELQTLYANDYNFSHSFHFRTDEYYGF